MDNHEPRAHARSDQRRLLIVLGVTSAYLLTELVGGYLTGSLALLSDAVHMLTDIAALCLGMLTLWISTRPASSAKTYGYLRAEILGALLNGLFLWVLVVFIWIEAFGRLRNPRPVSGLANHSGHRQPSRRQLAVSAPLRNLWRGRCPYSLVRWRDLRAARGI